MSAAAIPAASVPAGYHEVNIPDDNHCLFWSATLGVLLPALDDEKAFGAGYERLFGNTDSITLGMKSKRNPVTTGTEIKIADAKGGVRAMLRTYGCQKYSPLQFQGNVLGKLICEVFRNRVVDYMGQKFSKVEKQSIHTASGKSTWADYAANMRASG